MEVIFIQLHLDYISITFFAYFCNIENLKHKPKIAQMQQRQVKKRQKLLADKEYKKLLESENKIKKSGKKVTNDRLISEMTFGFWVHLCTKPYKPKFWDKKGFFEAVFPNYLPAQGLRRIAPIQNNLLAILRLRNRISHHEIIINDNKTPQEQYQLVLDIPHLLSTDMENLLNGISRIQDIIKQKP